MAAAAWMGNALLIAAMLACTSGLHTSRASVHMLAASVKPAAGLRTSQPAVRMLAASVKAAKSKPARSGGSGFGAKPSSSGTPAAVKALVSQGRSVRKLSTASLNDAMPWLSWAGAAAEAGEFAEARQILLLGRKRCGPEHDGPLTSAIGQMRRKEQLPEVAALAPSVQWPGQDDDSAYTHRPENFRRYSVPEPPTSCPRGSVHPSGEGIVVASVAPMIPADECEWVVSEVERVTGERWVQDHKDAGSIGEDQIWAKPFPDRLWLREVPGMTEWFDHRLRTRLFPMLQKLYPAIIHSPDELRCHDAFVVRYDAGGMAELELHQDTTSFSFTIALNPEADYGGGGTVFPKLRDPNADGAAGSSEFRRRAIKTDIGGVCSFPGRLFHGGNRVESGYRYIIPVFIYLDYNQSRKPRGYLLKKAGVVQSNEELVHFPF